MDYPLDYIGIADNIGRYYDLGIEVHITEMDVNCECNGNFTNEIETKQAEMYVTVLKACLAYSNCKNFETWGYTDKYTWLGSDAYPLPFAYDYSPKLAADDILATLQNGSDYSNIG